MILNFKNKDPPLVSNTLATKVIIQLDISYITRRDVLYISISRVGFKTESIRLIGLFPIE